ncbi:hypothetical protein CRG98_027435 [Punica granatum]|uniref:Protein kinase domain-containing protein n=1 Tax=Punica granatum TaxID=22663 RepID=A0A2I0J7F2_PUNGR|nr:hypothetical protein CRG98_027435 [Punica granatum]
MQALKKSLKLPSSLDWSNSDPCNWKQVQCISGRVTRIQIGSLSVSGTLPPDIQNLTSLQKFEVMNNKLTGNLPSFAGLSQLQTLLLHHNNFSSIPSDFFSGMTSLQVIDLSYNSFLPWEIPDSLLNATALKNFSANGANVVGKIPDFFNADNFPGMVELQLAMNNLEGGLPSGFVGSPLQSLWLNGQNGETKLNGTIEVLAKMTQLGEVWLHGNQFSGPIPELSNLKNLWFLSLRDNQLTGVVPDSLLKLPSLKFVNLTNNLLQGPTPAFGSSVTVDIGTGASSETYSQSSGRTGDVHVVEARNMVISIQVLRNVTNNFSEENVLGRGGFGTVYKGELHDGTKIAVKRMESSVVSEKGMTEFKSEIAVLTKVRHRHLVALLGYCLDGNERLLVYEYMPQGTLSKHLFHWKEEGLKPLEWTRRLTIALDVARGVEYLHSLAHQTFIHRDLKPSNILLGDDMRAKVADFGLVRLAPEGKGSIETCLAGTFGYLAPEYAVTGRVTTKVDVFSFGVILMEMITGRKALDETQLEDSVHLVTWFRRMHLNKETFRKAIDPVIDIDEETLGSISTVAELAGHCCAREPYQRPDMGHAVNVLSSLVELWKPAEPDSEDIYGIDLDMTLPQALKKWQEFEGVSNLDESSSSYLPSGESTQTSIPTRPSGFASSFTSADGR